MPDNLGENRRKIISAVFPKSHHDANTVLGLVLNKANFGEVSDVEGLFLSVLSSGLAEIDRFGRLEILQREPRFPVSGSKKIKFPLVPDGTYEVFVTRSERTGFLQIFFC